MQARDEYRNLSEEEKIKKTEYGKSRYRNISEERKQRLKNIKKIIARLKSVKIIINEIVFFNGNCNSNFNNYTNKIVFLIEI